MLRTHRDSNKKLCVWYTWRQKATLHGCGWVLKCTISFKKKVWMALYCILFPIYFFVYFFFSYLQPESVHLWLFCPICHKINSSFDLWNEWTISLCNWWVSSFLYFCLLFIFFLQFFCRRKLPTLVSFFIYMNVYGTNLFSSCMLFTAPFCMLHFFLIEILYTVSDIILCVMTVMKNSLKGQQVLIFGNLE